MRSETETIEARSPGNEMATVTSWHWTNEEI
jgi:hypothetical protein